MALDALESIWFEDHHALHPQLLAVPCVVDYLARNANTGADSDTGNDANHRQAAARRDISGDFSEL
jgi:hypothetical protein